MPGLQVGSLVTGRAEKWLGSIRSAAVCDHIHPFTPNLHCCQSLTLQLSWGALGQQRILQPLGLGWGEAQNCSGQGNESGCRIIFLLCPEIQPCASHDTTLWAGKYHLCCNHGYFSGELCFLWEYLCWNNIKILLWRGAPALLSPRIHVHMSSCAIVVPEEWDLFDKSFILKWELQKMFLCCFIAQAIKWTRDVILLLGWAESLCWGRSCRWFCGMLLRLQNIISV